MPRQRSVLRALVMGFIPVLHLYLFWKFCNEAKVCWKLAGLNSTLYTVMFLVPILNVYPLFKFLSYVQSNLGKGGKKAYPVPPLYLAIAACAWIIPFVLPVAWLIWLYIVYRTQSLFNENDVKSL